MRPATLIAMHEAADFDAYAAAVGAQRLHGGTIGMGRRLARPVRDFLALHKDRFPFRRVDHLELDAVEHLVVVDVRSRRRLKHVEPVLARRDAGGAVALTLYDHHPATDDDLVGDHEQVEPVGAATTLLVEELEATSAALDPVEATLYALGIYTDTAALTLGNTTPRDARAVAFLLDAGARLAILNRYLHPPLHEGQRDALRTILAAREVVDVAGLRVGIALLPAGPHREGLAEVTTAACKLDDLAALFVVSPVARKKVEVIARSRSPRLDVAAPLRRLGGGGHRGAASAAVKKGDAEGIATQLREHLAAAAPARRLVDEVMTSPVWTVAPTMSLRALGDALRRRGISGVPVVRDGALVGVASRRDVERATQHGRDHLPVASHMSGEVRTVSADAALDDALSLMADADVGRLPVIREGRLVGILSRSDALTVLYPSGEPSS